MKRKTTPPRIIQFLKTMTKGEKQHFRRYSSEFIEEENQGKVLDHLLACAEKDAMLDEKLVKKLLGKERNKLFHKLVDLAERYLASTQLAKKDYDLLRLALLLDNLRSSKEIGLFENTVRKTWKKQDKRAGGLDYYYSILKLIDAFDGHPNCEQLPEISPEEMFDWMSRQHCLGMLKFMSKTMFEKGVEAAKKFFTPLFETTLALSRSDEMKEVPLVNAYRLSIDLFLAFDDKNYKEFKEITLASILSLSGNEKIFLFNLLINHTAIAVRRNNNYLEDALKVYRFGISKGILLEDGYIHMGHFLNYITAACFHRRPRTASIFLRENQDYLHPRVKNQVINISNARIHLARKEYKESFTDLYQKKFQNVQLRLIARAIRLMACFEWEMNSSLPMPETSIGRELQSFSRHLEVVKSDLGERNSLYIANKSLYEFLRGMIQQMNETPDADLLKGDMLTQLDDIPQIACGGWLREKIEEL